METTTACQSKLIWAVTILGLLAAATAAQAAKKFEENWESLSRHKVPQWFKDAKFGIYTHWGVYSVPAFGNEWYPRNMYRKDSREHKHHVATYGPLSKFGYKDFIPMFKAEKFDADEWAELFVQAGAKFAGPVAEHHDGFSMWASKVNRWNVAAMGPKRDITGELVAALRKRGLKIITSFHHAFNIQGYYPTVEGTDTADPAYADLYGKFKDPKVAHERWLAKIKEVIDAYQPDQIWFDFGLGKIPDEYKLRMAAYYYNHEAEWGRELIITRKHNHLPEGVGVLDIERGKMDRLAEFLWQTDDSVATNTWGYTEQIHLKDAEELIHELIDIVSKNGVLLLNVAPKSDGTISDDQKQLLLEIGKWLKVNGQAIYGTRTWRIHGEGPRLYDRGRGLGRSARGQVRFTGEDIRFTRKGQTLYAICLGWPGKRMSLSSLIVKSAPVSAKVTLLGYPKPLTYSVEDGRLTVAVPNLSPAQRPCRYAYSFKLEGFAFDVDPFALPGAVTVKASEATLDGDQIRVEDKYGQPNIGFWDKPNESAHWLVRITRPGKYLVRARVSAAAGASKLALVMTRETTQSKLHYELKFQVPRTKDWAGAVTVKAGQLQFGAAGIYHLIVRPADPKNWRAVNLWQIEFAPVP